MARARQVIEEKENRETKEKENLTFERQVFTECSDKPL
jgi:hypothetical protein